MKARAWSLLSLLPLSVGLGFGCAPDVLIAEQDTASGVAGEDAAGAGGENGAAFGGAGEAAGGGAAADATGGSPQAGAPFVPEQDTHLLADSIADFSLVQGERGWTYGYDLGSIESFALLTRTSVITAYVPATADVWDCWVTEPTHWTQIFQLGAHPNGTDTSAPSEPVLERAVRRWTSNYQGDVRITGEIAKIDVTPGGSNGIDALILVDGVQLFATFIAGEDAGGWGYEVAGSVLVGSNIDFVLDAHEGSDHHDLTRFTAVIEKARPTPSE